MTTREGIEAAVALLAYIGAIIIVPVLVARARLKQRKRK